MPRYRANQLEKASAEVFIRAGVPETYARTVAQSLVHADLRGIESHGLSRLPIYVERIVAGLIDVHKEPQILSRDGAAGLIDGGNQLGAVVGMRALEQSMEIARNTGVGFVGVRHSNHFGSCSFYAEQAIEKGLILLVLSNAPEAMAPTGGIQPFFGTNPIAIGIPAGEESPFLLDMATSVVARGKIALAAKQKVSIPSDWALDKNGAPTTDPNQALLGSLLPIGGAKGYGMAMFIDIFCGVLTGGASGTDVRSLYDNWEQPQDIGHVFLTVDIQRFMPIETFRSRMDAYIRQIKAVPKAKGTAEIFIPGEIERRRMRDQLENGIQLSKATLAELTPVFDTYGVDLSQALILS